MRLSLRLLVVIPLVSFAHQALACDETASVSTCEKECKSGDKKACALLGIKFLQEGKTAEAEPPLLKACKAKVGLGCGGLGSLYGLLKQPAKSKKYLTKGCSLNDGLACESLGGLTQFDKKPNQTTARLRRSIPYYRKACKLGATRGCGWVAAAISEGLIEGTLKEALQLHTKACHGPYPMPIACRHAVGLFHKGTPESKQLAKEFDVSRLSVDLLTRGCKLGDQKSCDLQKLSR